MQRLLDRGVSQFKFVDRTFNLNIATSKAILEFFLERHRPGLFVHFEMIPDRLPEALREVIARFPPGALQFEVGIQTFNPAVSTNISRRQDYARLADNFRFLRRQTGVHVHADLIAGLPGETLESFAAGFDRLVALGPQEIQVGILKRLRGTPIVRHDEAWQMVYSAHPPYEILQNKLHGFRDDAAVAPFCPLLGPGRQQRQFRGNHAAVVERRARSPFAAFMKWSDWLYGRIGRRHAIALARLAELLFEYLTDRIGPAVRRKWRKASGATGSSAGRREKPEFLAACFRNRKPGQRPSQPPPQNDRPGTWGWKSKN